MQHRHEFSDALCEFVLRTRQRNDGGDLGEIGVSRGAGQQLQFGSQPASLSPIHGRLPGHLPSRPAIKSSSRRDRLPAAAPYARVPRLSTGAEFLHPHWLLALRAAMDHPLPVDVLQVSILAATNETDRRHRLSCACFIDPVSPPKGFEFFPTHQPPSPRILGGRSRRSEPCWEYADLNAWRRQPWSVLPIGGVRKDSGRPPASRPSCSDRSRSTSSIAALR